MSKPFSDHINSFLNNKKSRIVLLLLFSLLFFALRFQDLSLPYFWDEMAGYMSGVLYQVDHGISLHPGSIPPELSYGHPLLMHAFLALVVTVFGSEVYILHTTTVIFTVLLAWSTYLLAYEICKNHLVSLFGFLILLAQPIVIAQSTQVLLEVLLSLLFVYSILFYFKKNYFLSALFCTLAVLTKETGLVLAIAYPVHFVVKAWMLGNVKTTIKKSIVYLLPFAVFISFLIAQKQAHGWYLNPVNVGKTKLTLISMLQKIWDYPLEFTLINQGRYWYTLLILLLFIFTWMKRSKFKTRLSMELVLIYIFCFGFILFSSIADTLERYFIVLIPFAAIAFAFTLNQYKRYHALLPILLCCIGLAINSMYLDNEKRYSEADLSYRHMVETNVAVIDYVNSGAFQGDTIGFAFPLQLAVTDSRYGYFKKLNFTPDTAFRSDTKLKVYCSPGNLDWNLKEIKGSKMLKEFNSFYSKSALYKK